jgi:multisubunit Na+/H+ antiporter MnhE subunit
VPSLVRAGGDFDPGSHHAPRGGAVITFLASAGLWIALTQRFDVYCLALGLTIALLIAVVQRKLFPSTRFLSRERFSRLPLVLPYFVTLLFRLVLSTIRTSWLILAGKEEGQIVALPTSMKNPFGRFILLHSITLTPSTIALLSEEDLLYIHWLRPRGRRGDWEEIKASLEKRLAPIFGGSDDASLHQ